MTVAPLPVGENRASSNPISHYQSPRSGIHNSPADPGSRSISSSGKNPDATETVPPLGSRSIDKTSFSWSHPSSQIQRLTQVTNNSLYSQPDSMGIIKIVDHKASPPLDFLGQASIALDRFTPSPITIASFPLPPNGARSQITQDPTRNLEYPRIPSLYEFENGHTVFTHDRDGSTFIGRPFETDVNPSRRTRNWYDKPLWDSQSRMSDDNGGSRKEREDLISPRRRDKVKSRKSVRWGDEGSELDLTSLAKAM